MFILAILIFCLVGYLIGNFLFALIIGRIIFRVDIRTQGSKNPGTTNLIRVTGGNFKSKIWGIIAALLDMFKGVIAVTICMCIYEYGMRNWNWGTDFTIENSWITFFCVPACVIGHCFPLGYLYTLIKTRSFAEAKAYCGGKGAATFEGSFFIFCPLISICLFVIWFGIKK